MHKHLNGYSINKPSSCFNLSNFIIGIKIITIHDESIDTYTNKNDDKRSTQSIKIVCKSAEAVNEAVINLMTSSVSQKL